MNSRHYIMKWVWIGFIVIIVLTFAEFTYRNSTDMRKIENNNNIRNLENTTETDEAKKVVSDMDMVTKHTKIWLVPLDVAKLKCQTLKEDADNNNGEFWRDEEWLMEKGMILSSCENWYGLGLQQFQTTALIEQKGILDRSLIKHFPKLHHYTFTYYLQYFSQEKIIVLYDALLHPTSETNGTDPKADSIDKKDPREEAVSEPIYKYLLKQYAGKVVVYEANGENCLFETDLELQKLPVEARLKMEKGIYLMDERELYNFLESYSS